MAIPWPSRRALCTCVNSSAVRRAWLFSITPARLEYFEIWRTVRNASLGTRMLRDFIDGAVGGLESCAVAVNTFPRIESQLAASLVKVLA